MKKSLTKLRNAVARPYHLVQAWRAADKYDYPAAGMTVIGVTGTNGKTTTCWMIYQMLKSAGKKVGLMSTIGDALWNSDAVTAQTAHMTTESSAVLNKHLAEFRDAGVEFLVLEVSSHALSQHRIFGAPVDIAVFTNLSHEHLDYHKTFAKYRAAKEKLFKMAAARAKHGGRGVGVINADDAVAGWFYRDVPTPLTYGVANAAADLRARQVKLTPRGVEYYVKTGGQTFHVKTKIAGEFNVYNSLAAVGVGLALKLNKQQIEQGIFALDGVAGRMNRIDEGQNFDVIIDFAHTPDAFAKLLPDLKKATKGRVISLFGIAGERDQSKAGDMGRVAAENSDIVILTEDDPRGAVRPQSEKLARGAEAAGKIREKNLFLIDDRTAAIEFACQTAKAGDTVVLMGKGHERTIARANGDEPWDEAGAARKILKKIVAKKS